MSAQRVDLAEIKARFPKSRLLELAEQEGLTVRGGKSSCPRRCSDSPDSASYFEKDGSAGWKCHRCEAGGDVFTLVESTRNLDFREALQVVEQLAGVVHPKPGRRPTPPIGELWAALVDDDHAVRHYLDTRGLAGALDRGLARCNVGRSGFWWLDSRARDGYRLAVGLFNTAGALFSLQVRSVTAQADPKKTKLNCLGIDYPAGKLAMGDVAGARSAPLVHLTEGIADTLALQLAGAVALGAPGVECVSALPGFLGDVAGRTVVLCPQNDAGHTRARLRSEQVFAAVRDQLRSRGARVLVLATPAEHKDPADWLRAVGPEAFAAAVRDRPAEDLELQPAPEPAEPQPVAQGSSALAARPLAEVIPLHKRFALTDTGNAERMVAQHGGDLRFCHTWGSWLVWDGVRWERDATSEVHRLAKATVRTMRDEYQREVERRRKNPLLQRADEYLSALGEFAKKSESRDRRRAIVDLAAVESEVSIRAEQLDASPWLINLQNGTVDLRSGSLDPHQRDQLLTRVIPIQFDPAAECPRWRQFIGEIFLGNEELISFVQRCVGYSLTGLTQEQVFFLCYGTGENGKSAFLSMLESLLGDYALTADFNTFAAGDVAPGAPRPDLVRLRGARLVTAAEPDQKIHLSESRLKQITGEDPIVARSLHEREQEFRPILKLWLMANHKPTVTESNHGFWRRVRLIPFDYRVPAATKDAGLKEKLRAELPGILRWALEGCLAWQRSGLGEARAVSEATEEYRSEMDVLGRFFEDCCELDREHSCPAAELYDAYEKWCGYVSEKPMSKVAFGRKLKDRGLRQDRTKVGRFWSGVRVLPRKPARPEGGDR